MQINEITGLYFEKNLSLRAICRMKGLKESSKSKLSILLRNHGYKIRRGKVGLKVGDYITVICPQCNEERKIKLKCHKQKIGLCGSCATKKSHKNNPRIGRAENHYNWKGGININQQGYIIEYVKKDSKWFSMAVNNHKAGGYILQHRLVMAKHLGRCLFKNEMVHHINGDRKNNKIENLKLLDKKEHKITYQDGYRDGFADAMKLNNKKRNGKEWIKI